MVDGRLMNGRTVMDVGQIGMFEDVSGPSVFIRDQIVTETIPFVAISFVTLTSDILAS